MPFLFTDRAIRSSRQRIGRLAGPQPNTQHRHAGRILGYVPKPARTTRLLVALVVIAGLLAAATLLVDVLEATLGVPNADAVYLLAVVAAAVIFGTSAAIGTAVASFLLYDFFFVKPTLTLSVADRTAWVDLALLLGVGAIVGQLAAMQRNRAEAAERRERESQALYVVSRELARRHEPLEGMAEVVPTLAMATGMRSLWVGLGRSPEQERVAAGTGPDPRSMSRIHCLLRSGPAGPADWVTLHAPFRTADEARPRAATTYRVVIEAEGEPCGSIWAVRESDAGPPDEGQTRVLSVAADQLGRTIERKRLGERAAAAEVARRSESLKSALLDSVSHDLRTPLASIRAAAGNLMDVDLTWSPEEEREVAATIDREAERLNELVTNLLDMSRIEAGELVAHPEPFSLEDLVRGCLARRRSRLEPRRVLVDLDPSLPPVLVDGLFVEQVLVNVLDNVAHHTPATTTIHVHDERTPVQGMIRVVIEDDGPGVPPEALDRLFDKFFRVRRGSDGSRGGTGVGLSVARGLVEAMGGHIGARASEGGGLAIVIDLPSDDRTGTGAPPDRLAVAPQTPAPQDGTAP